MDNKELEEEFYIPLEVGKCVVFDFDGIIHKYSQGWQDGKIYDEYNKDALDIMLVLQSIKIPVAIVSTREPQQIKDWWDKQGFSMKAKCLDSKIKFHNDVNVVGITNRKLVAQLYIDDRGYRYEGQNLKEFLLSLGTKINNESN